MTRRDRAPEVGTTSWPAVTLGALVVIAEGYDLIVYGALLPQLLTEPGWELTAARAGAIGSQIYVGMLVGALAGGPVCDRVGRRRFVNTAVAWFALWTFGCAFAQEPWQLGATRLLAGLGMGAAIPAVIALAKEHAAPRRTGLVVTVLMAGIPVGGTTSALLGIVVLPAHGWRPMFLIGGALSVLVLVLSLVKLPESRAFAPGAPADDRPAAPSALRAVAELFRERRAVLSLLFAAATFTNLLSWYGLNTWLTSLMRQLHYPLGSALQFSVALNTGAVVGSLMLVAAADRWGTRQVATVCGVVTAAGILVFTAGPAGTALLLTVVAVIGANAQTALTMILASVADSYPTRMRATAIGWANGTGRIGAVVAPALGGAVLAAGLGPSPVFTTFAASSLVAAGAMALLVVHARGRRTRDAADVPLAAP